LLIDLSVYLFIYCILPCFNAVAWVTGGGANIKVVPQEFAKVYFKGKGKKQTADK